MIADRCPESGIDSEVLLSQEFTILTKEDEQWLSSYGVDNTWTEDPEQFKSLNDTVNVGSFRLNGSENQEKWQDVILARQRFLGLIGLSAEFIESYQAQLPTLVPLDTFIGTQRVLKSWGLDAVKLINAMPSAISYAPESVRMKMRFLRRSVKLFKWEHSAEELVNSQPTLIYLSTKRLAVLQRIAATYLEPSSKESSPKTLRSSLVIPLENYIIAASNLKEGQRVSLKELNRAARAIKLKSPERKDLVLKNAPSLGRIGIKYEAYSEKK